MTFSSLSSHFAQVQQGLAREVSPKILIKNRYSSSLFHTRIRGNLRASAAIVGIVSAGSLCIERHPPTIGAVTDPS
jgi:hypothetical protein